MRNKATVSIIFKLQFPILNLIGICSIGFICGHTNWQADGHNLSVCVNINTNNAWKDITTCWPHRANRTCVLKTSKAGKREVCTAHSPHSRSTSKSSLAYLLKRSSYYTCKQSLSWWVSHSQRVPSVDSWYDFILMIDFVRYHWMYDSMPKRSWFICIFSFRDSAALSVENCPTFRQMLPLPPSEWMCIG